MTPQEFFKGILCVCAYTHAHTLTEARRLTESLGTGVTGVLALLDVAAGIQTLVLST